MTATSAIAEAAVSHGEFLESVEAQIQRRLGGRVRDLRVVLRDNGVILQGRSATYHAKQLAQHAAMDITGLRILANDIEVC
jgi:osmotically-inducible protein OsmY